MFFTGTYCFMIPAWQKEQQTWILVDVEGHFSTKPHGSTFSLESHTATPYYSRIFRTKNIIFSTQILKTVKKSFRVIDFGIPIHIYPKLTSWLLLLKVQSTTLRLRTTFRKKQNLSASFHQNHIVQKLQKVLFISTYLDIQCHFFQNYLLHSFWKGLNIQFSCRRAIKKRSFLRSKSGMSKILDMQRKQLLISVLKLTMLHK